MPPSLGPVGLDWGEGPLPRTDPQMLPPKKVSGLREMNRRQQTTRMGMKSGAGGGKAAARPHPLYLRPLAGSQDGSEPRRAAGTETGSRAGGQVLQGPHRSHLPALVSLCISRRRSDLHKPLLIPGKLGVDWLHWSGGRGFRWDPVVWEARLQERAPPARADLPAVVQRGEAVPHSYPALRLRHRAAVWGEK